MVELNNPCLQGDNYSAEHGCFEGPEKLLEIWFSPSPNSLADHQDLHYDSSEGGDLSSTEEDEPKDIARFSPPRPSSPIHTKCKSGLRVVPRPVWDDVLARVKCTVLNTIMNDHVDAYLLR